MLGRLLEFRNTREGLGPGEEKKGPGRKAERKPCRRKPRLGSGFGFSMTGRAVLKPTLAKQAAQVFPDDRLHEIMQGIIDANGRAENTLQRKRGQMRIPTFSVTTFNRYYCWYNFFFVLF